MRRRVWPLTLVMVAACSGGNARDAGGSDDAGARDLKGDRCSDPIVLALPDDGGWVEAPVDPRAHRKQDTCFSDPPLQRIIVRLDVPDAGVVDVEAPALSLSLRGDGVCFSDTSLRPLDCRGPPTAIDLHAVGNGRLRGRVGSPSAVLWGAGAAPGVLKARWAPHPPGNLCEAPFALRLDGGFGQSAAAIGSTVNLCGQAFWLSLEADELSVASTTIQCSGGNGSVRSANACPTVTERNACTAASAGQFVSLVKAGTHRYLAHGEGQCLITAAVQPAAVGESCLKPATLTTSVVDAGVEGATLSAETGGHVAEGSVPCAAGPDVAYRFTLSQPRDVAARVTTTDAAFKPALALWKDKCSGTAAACAAASLAGAGAEVTVTAAPAGEYFVAVGGENGGPFTLQVTLK